MSDERLTDEVILQLSQIGSSNSVDARHLGMLAREVAERRGLIKRAEITLFKPGGKYYTTEKWRIPSPCLVPDEMVNSPDFRRIDGGPVLVETQEPWGYPALLSFNDPGSTR